MQYTTILRWEFARLGLGALARLVAFDAKPTAGDRSRAQHLRNGLGALLSVSSEVAVHGNAIASGWHAARNPARAELHYALSELRQADLLKSGTRFARRNAPALLLATSAGLLLGIRASRA